MQGEDVTPPAPRRGGIRTGIALGPPRATACEAPGALRPRPGRRHEHALPAPGAEGWGAALAAWLGELRAAGTAEVHVALLRPLAATKALRLPPVRGAALRPLAERGAERWFPLAGGARVDAVPLRGAADGEPNALVSACDAALVETVAEAAREAGVALGSVTPAVFAAAAGAARVDPGLARGRQLLVLLFAHATEAVLLEAGAPARVRSLPFADLDGTAASRRAAQVRELVRAMGEGEDGTPPAVSLAGEVDAALEEALGATPDELGPARVPFAGSAEALAAFGAALPAARRHDLRPEAHRAPSRRAARRRTAVLLAGAAALAAVAAAAHLRALEEAGDRAARMRATLRPGVESVLRTRAEIDSVRARLAALDRAEAARQRWVPFFARLGEVLPRDAYVQSLRAEGGTEVSIEGYARSASSLVLALGRAADLRGVRFTSSVQREQTPAGERERFSLRFGAPAFLPAPPDTAGAILPGTGARASSAAVRSGGTSSSILPEGAP